MPIKRTFNFLLLLVTGYLLLFTFPKETFATVTVDIRANNSPVVTIDSGQPVSLAWIITSSDSGNFSGCQQWGSWPPPGANLTFSPGEDSISTGPLIGPSTYTYTLYCVEADADGNVFDFDIASVQVNVNAPLCDNTPINCTDSVTYNTCSANNDTRTCTLSRTLVCVSRSPFGCILYEFSSACTQVQTSQVLTVDNCNYPGGYVCQGGSCNLINTSDLKVYDYSNSAWSDGTISIPQNSSNNIFLSWRTTGTINSCTVTDSVGHVFSTSLNDSMTINKNMYSIGQTIQFNLGCRSSQGYGFADYVGVTIGNPFCTTNPVCGGCGAPTNTCSTNNGTQNCTLTGPTPCTQVGINRQCTVNNCEPAQGYSCVSGTCVRAPSSYSLEVRPGGTGSGTVSSSPAGINSCGVGSSCSANFATGTSVTLTATPASGSTFTGWSGACSGTGSCSVTMDASKTLSATFSQNPNCSTSSTPWTSVTCVLRSDITTTNTCSQNGRQTRTLDGPTPCIQTTQTQDCNVPNCSSGYVCSASGICVLPVQSCPTTCHTDTQYVPDGFGGQTTCSPTNTSSDYARQEPPACSTTGGTLRDGQCSTYTYPANCTGVCEGSQCTIAPTVNLLVNGVDGTSGLPHNSTANLSWITGNSPTSCTLYLLTGSGWVSLGNQPLITPNVTTDQLAGPATYYFGMYCFNAAGTSNFDYVPVGINAPAGASCSVSPTFTYTGQNVTWSATASGGTGTYTYSWSGTDGLSGISSSVVKSYSGEGPKTGSVTVTSGPSTTVNCSNSVQACYPPQSCPTACHTNDQTVPNGSCGQTSCPHNQPGPENCPSTCHTDTQYVYDGTSCNQTRACLATNTSPDYARQEPPACRTTGGTLRDGQCSTYTYSANCVGDGATCQGNTCVIKPTVDLYVNFSVSPVPVPDGNNVIVTWGNTNSPTSTCSASSTDNVWTGTKDNAGGLQLVGPLSGATGGKTYTFTLTCSNAAAPLGITKSVPIYVYAPVSGSCSVSPTSAKTGDTVTWSTSNVSGGNGTYSYSWSGDENLTGTNSSVTKSYSSQGPKSASVIITSGSQSATLNCPTLSVQNPNCTDTIICDQTCNLSPNQTNTCSQNGTKSCQYTGPGTCTQVPAPSQTCDYPNCSAGYNCSPSGTCIPNVIAPTVDLTVNTVTIDNGQAATLSWTTTNSPTSCTASATPVSTTWTGDPGHEAINSRSTGNLYGPWIYTYSITCSNSAGTSPPNSVSITVNNPPIVSIDDQIRRAIEDALRILSGGIQ